MIVKLHLILSLFLFSAPIHTLSHFNCLYLSVSCLLSPWSVLFSHCLIFLFSIVDHLCSQTHDEIDRHRVLPVLANAAKHFQATDGAVINREILKGVQISIFHNELKALNVLSHQFALETLSLVSLAHLMTFIIF